MAKFGVDVTGMGSVSGMGVFSSRVSQGVQNNSEAMRTQALTGAIGTAGQMGVEAYKGYQLADLEKEQEKNVSDFMASKQNPKIADEAAVDAAAFRHSADTIWDNFDTTIEDVNPIEKKFQEKLSMYEKAVKEGVMTPDQLNTRILATTREAVNRNPGMYAELVAHSKKILELSGVQSAVEKEQQQATDVNKTWEDLRGRAKKENISYTTTTPFLELQSRVVEAENDTRTFEMSKRAIEKHKLGTEADAWAWEANAGDATQRGALNSFSTGLASIFRDNNTTSFANVSAQITNFADIKKEEFASLIPVQIRNTPEAKARMERYNNYIDSSVESMQKLGSGEDARKAAENALAVVDTAEKMGLHKQYNVAAANMAINLLKAAPEVIVKDQKVRQTIMELTSNVLSGNFSSPMVTGALPKNIEDKKASVPLSSAVELGRTTGDWNTFNKVTESYNALSSQIKDPVQKQIFVYNNLEALAKADMSGLDSNGVSQVRKLVGTYLDDPQFGLKSMFANLKNSNAMLDVLPDGRLFFTGEGAEQFNARYGAKINTSLQAYANAQGSSVKEGATTFYKDYFAKHLEANQMMQDPDIGKPTKAAPAMRKGEVAGTIQGVRMDVTPERQAQMTALKQAERGTNLQTDIAELEQALKTAKGTARGILMREYRDLTGKDYGTQ